MVTSTAGGKYNTGSDKRTYILTVAWCPIGLQTTLQGMTEGLTNAPKLYGSEVRDSKKVTGFVSGVVEGGKVSLS